jgi:hypothetical protein
MLLRPEGEAGLAKWKAHKTLREALPGAHGFMHSIGAVSQTV